MEKIGQLWGKNWKTNFLVIVALALSGALQQEIITQQQYAGFMTIVGPLIVAALRAGVKKSGNGPEKPKNA